MTTVAPDPDKFEVKAQIDYSDDGKFSSQFGEETACAVFNAPISQNSAIRLAVSDDRTKGVQVNDFTHDANVSTEWGARLRYLIKPTDDLTVNLIADYDRRGQNYNDPQFNYVSANPGLAAELTACGITPSYANQARCGSAANDTNYRNYGASAQIDYSLGSASLTSITGYRKIITAPSDFDAQGVAAEFAQIFQVGQFASGRQFSQELRISSSGKTDRGLHRRIVLFVLFGGNGLCTGRRILRRYLRSASDALHAAAIPLDSVCSNAHLDGHDQQVRGCFRAVGSIT